MPPESLWVQFSVVGILVLSAGVIAYAFYKLFRDLLAFIKEQDALRTAWMTDQDLKREQEREKQRLWQSEQDKVRDDRWQLFLKSMQDAWIAQDGKHTDTLRALSTKIDSLISDIDDHHQMMREAITVMKERTGKQ